MNAAPILTPDQRIRVFVSSTLNEMADERSAVRRAIERLFLVPVMFELGARPHPPRSLYLAYLRQSHLFVGIYGEEYGWVAPDMSVSGLEDELDHAEQLPRLLYVKTPAPDRDPRLTALLDRITRAGDVSYTSFTTADELETVLAADLAVLITERFACPTGTPADTLAEVRPLPTPATDFVGRAREAGELAALLTGGPGRIVTLTGPGGIGKTRLALYTAARLRDRFPDGVAFVPLATRAPEDLLEAVAAALAVKDLGQLSLPDLLASHLADRDVLLVLDNFEHMLPGAQALADLVVRAPRLQLLVTSRTAIHVSGEVEFPVPPLSVPLADDVESVRRSEAVQLLVRRISAVTRDFALDSAHARTVAAICRRLDGLPLALELVAARANVLTVDEISERLDKVLDLPARARDVPERQRTLRRTMDWSYEQLDPPAREVFAQLSVFAGSFSIAAAEAVADVDPTVDILDALATLVDHSLLRSRLANGRARFSMLETIREYARTLVTDAAADQLAVRHAAYFRDVAMQSHAKLRGRSQKTALAGLDLDAPDISAAVEWFIAQRRREDVADMTWAIWPYFWLRGALTSTRRATSRSLAAEGPLSALKLGRLLVADAFMALWQRSFDVAMSELLQARDIAADERDDELAAMTNMLLMIALGGMGDAEQARPLGEEALRLARQQGDEWLAAYCLSGLCWVAVALDRMDVDEPLFEPMLAAAQAVEDPLALALATENMAELSMHRGATAEAARLARDSLLSFSDLDMVYACWSALALSALVLAEAGDDDLAVSVQAGAEAAMRSIDAEPWPPLAARQERMLGRLRAALGDDRYRRAWAQGSGWGFHGTVDATVTGLGKVLMTRATEPTSPLTKVPPLHTAAGGAVGDDAGIRAMTEADLLAGIDQLRKERNAVILAHNYQIPEIQDLADFVGDSLQPAQQAAATDADVIAFCGVHFMAETAAITCPDKVVLIPDPEAGCSLAESVTAADVREWRASHPDGVVVAYVNTDAEVKAEVDYCCTSSNAVQVVTSIPPDREILFVPDQFLGRYVKSRSGRNMELWLGECHVHAAIGPEDVDRLMAQHPGADLLLHPECGCISQCLWRLAEGELPADRTQVLSTGGMVRHARDCPHPVDLVGTEVGMLHRLRQANPSKTFVPLREDAVCSYMKTITLPKLYRALRDMVYVVRVPDDVAARARVAIDRMLAVPTG